MRSFYFPVATLVLTLHLQLATAFVNKASGDVCRPTKSPTCLFSTELVPEPDGGTVLTAVKTMEGSKMKNMGENPEITSKDGQVYKFWLTAKVEGSLVKEIHGEVLKQSAKKANFPGFRKGQVPPYAMPQIRGFAVEESIVRTCQSAVDAYGLKSLSGTDGSVDVLEDIPAVANEYKLGDDLQFTATFNAIFDPTLTKSTSDDKAIMDVEAEEVPASTE
ncbi:bacterial trigger factor-like protein [Nitzschia inconspicua]|uniref:Bacterial trigger factor-like protein n=1 Tax=Nitzschia inconspicua TaxID=303405 RepID=A0A9K3PJN2_9STRA|nr:bacterial trigger factor-like protein [Nitzschia inconspicua]